jgi:hypothetical protein
MSVISFGWTDIPIKTGSEGVSGEILEILRTLHQRDTEGRSSVGEDIFFVIACDLKSEAVSVHIDVDHLIVSVDDVDRRAGE